MPGKAMDAGNKDLDSGDTIKSKDLASFDSLGPADKTEAEKPPPPAKRSSSGFMARMLAAVASERAKAPVSSKNNNHSKSGGLGYDSSRDSAGDILKHKSMAIKSVESNVTTSLEEAANAETTVPLNPPAQSTSEKRDSFNKKAFKSVDSDVFHSLMSVKPPALSSGDEEKEPATGKRKAVPASATEQNDSKFSKRELASLFNSGGSTNEILKQEIFKSVVADELKSLNSVGNSMDMMAAPLLRASSSSSGAFLQSMLATTAKPSSDTQGNGDNKSGKMDWEAIQRQGLGAATATAAASGNNTGGATASGEKKEKPKRPPRKRKCRIPEIKNYFEPSDMDVLCGRGGRANNHPGNKKYLELKDQVRPRYTAATKAAKTGIAEEVVDAIMKEFGGRFLAMDTKVDKWYEIDRLEARRKCSQALREENTAEARANKRAKYPKKKKADKEKKEEYP